AFSATPTPEEVQVWTPTPGPNDPPTGLSLVRENGQPALVWNAVPGVGVSYQLMVSRTSGSGYVPLGGAMSGTQLVIADVPQTLYVVVVAIRRSGSGALRSSPSNEVA